ncbi:two-component regulator propeller domain-containing protein [Bacteroidota bacterium]
MNKISLAFLRIYIQTIIMIRSCITFLFLTLLAGSLGAQAGIGEWRTHLPYKVGRQVSVAGDRIYCGTKSGLYYYDKQYNTVNIITKSEGLSDLEINALNYSSDRGTLVIGYANTNIDIIEGDDIFNIPDIKRKQITANKSINNILIIDDLAYLSCGFGIVVVNLEKKEIKDTYLIGENGGFRNVYDMATDGSNLYAATEQGIYIADINNANLVDFSNWSGINDIPHADGVFSTICWFQNKLYAGFRNEGVTGDSLYFRENGVWMNFQTKQNTRVRHVREESNHLLVVTEQFTTAYDAQHQEIRSVYSSRPVHAFLDTDNNLWVADGLEGLFRSAPGWDKEFMSPNGPISGDVASIAIQDDVLYTAAGNVSGGWGNTWNHAELNVLQGNFWTGTSTVDYRDLINLAIDPGDKNHVYGTTWGYGLLEYRNGELIEAFDNTNSSLQTLDEGGDFYRLGGCVFDQGNNLWISNSAVPEPISVRKADGTWKSFTLDGKLKVDFLGRIINTQNDHKWIICPLGHGIFAIDVNGSIDDISDDRYEKFDVIDVNGKIISNNVFSLAEEQNGNIWVGTDKGIVVYYSPTRVFDDGPFYGQQIIVPRNDGTGLADILLGTEKVTAIAVDGANRKWIGTDKSGIYLISEGGLEEIHHFTQDDSPLLSNNITDIAINPENGIVYIGTDRGLISYKSTAIEGREDYSGVYVYPNPVRHDHQGEIVITGLPGNVNVKITDITGNIVFETNSLGGQAIWDGRSFSGDRVRTGVYLIFCTDEEGTQTHITKLLVIN